MSGPQDKVAAPIIHQNTNSGPLLFSLLLVVLSVVMLPWFLTAAATQQDGNLSNIDIQPLGAIEGWDGPISYSGNWSPYYRGAKEYVTSYSREGQVVTVYIAYYTSQNQDQELVNFKHTLLNEHWRPYRQRSLVAGESGNALKVLATQVATDFGEVDMYSWYYVAGFETPDRRVAKLLEAAKIVSNNKVSAVVGILSGGEQINIKSDSNFILDLREQVRLVLEGL